jgi:hypothetical protein
LQESFSLNGKGPTLSRKSIIPVPSRLTTPMVVNGQRIKHYISDTPINVETNIIITITPEEYIRETYQNVSDSEKE